MIEQTEKGPEAKLGLIGAVLGIVAAASLWPATALAATLKVCQTCAYKQLAPALAVAHDGDTVEIGSGTYAGGLTITTSIALTGAGAGSTVIKGSGQTDRSVLTIGTLGASTEPSVEIDGVTITGGVAHSSPESTAFAGVDGVRANGGGVEIPPSAKQLSNRDNNDAPGPGGATVTISNSAITGNLAAPAKTTTSGGGSSCGPDGWPCCPPGTRCPFAGAAGGGIDNWGQLTLKNSTVTNNTASGVASDADGGGINSNAGSITLLNAVVTGNRAIAVDPNGRFAEGGGLFVETGTLTITDSNISHNSTRLSSSLISPFDPGSGTDCPNPCHIDMSANSGALRVSDGVPTTIDDSTFNYNSVSASNLSGEANAFDAAILIGDSPFSLRDSTVRGNQVTDTLSSSDYPGPGGSAIELDGPGTIANSDISDNGAFESSPGDASANGGLAILPFNYANGTPPTVQVTDSRIVGNSGTATGGASAAALGGGVFNNGELELQHVSVSGNSDTAHGPAGVAQGAGVWNGVDLAGPPVALTLIDSTITLNALSGTAGIALQGAGLFTPGTPFTLTNSHINQNTPDQCYGCGPAPDRRARQPRSSSRDTEIQSQSVVLRPDHHQRQHGRKSTHGRHGRSSRRTR